VIEETDGGQVTLDQGSRQGVETGQLVTDLSGALVGRVTQVQEDTAQVTLTWAAGFSLWVSSGDGTVRGLLRGGGVQGVALFTTMTQEPELGETLVTFAPGGTYPSGLPVGTLTGRTADTGGLTRRGRVTLEAGVCLADSVCILTGFQEEAA
jgi:rod shape-determining protein MreC